MPERTADLTLTGRLLLWTARHWARAHTRRRDLPGFVLHTISQLPAGERILPAVEAWLAVLALGARQPLCFAAPETPALTPDERVLLLVLIAAGRGLDDEIRPLLADLQHAGGLRGAQHCTLVLGRLLAHAHLPLTLGESWLPDPLAGARDAGREAGRNAERTAEQDAFGTPSTGRRCSRPDALIHRTEPTPRSATSRFVHK